MRIRAGVREEEGAAAVEFAIIAGLLFMLIFGMIEYGIAFFQMQSLRAATREGARVGAVGGTPEQIRQRTIDASVGALDSSSGIEIDPDSGCTSGTNDSVTVSVNLATVPPSTQQALSLDIPFLPPIVLNPPIQGTFRCEG
jgi:Flp pilus assembly protein TadG